MGKIDINSKCKCGQGRQGALKREPDPDDKFRIFKSGWSEKHDNATKIHKSNPGAEGQLPKNDA